MSLHAAIMSTRLLIGLLVYIFASIFLGFVCGRRGVLFALALIPLAFAYELIRRHFGETWCLVLAIPILACGFYFRRPRVEKTGGEDDVDTS